MADSKHFGNPKILQFGDKTAGNRPGDSGHCAECEAMLADALDGTLSPADQALFDSHLSECGPCGQLLADARRGAAFLEMLRHPAPEPPAALLERILNETSGSAAHAIPDAGFQPVPQSFGVAALAPGYVTAGNVLPFRVRAAAAMRRSAFGQILLQPRLAMTAAMAFFSVTLTMNLMGIHPLELRASDLTPSSLKRDITNANAGVVRYYEGLRVVYELESRVHDMESAQDNEPAAPPTQPGGEPAAPDAGTAPANATPANGASPNNQATPQPEGKEPGSNQPEQQKKAAPGPGSSRREDLDRSRRIFVADALDSMSPVRGKRTLV